MSNLVNLYDEAIRVGYDLAYYRHSLRECIKNAVIDLNKYKILEIGANIHVGDMRFSDNFDFDLRAGLWTGAIIAQEIYPRAYIHRRPK